MRKKIKILFSAIAILITVAVFSQNSFAFKKTEIIVTCLVAPGHTCEIEPGVTWVDRLPVIIIIEDN